MGLNANGMGFSTDTLRVEISEPSQPHLTIVDLPGLFLAGTKTRLVLSLCCAGPFMYEEASEHHLSRGLHKM